MQALLRKCETALESALESLDDHVLYAEQKRQRIRLQLTYIHVPLACDDSILFSGERMTSTGNKILIMIIIAAEFLFAITARQRVSGESTTCFITRRTVWYSTRMTRTPIAPSK